MNYKQILNEIKLINAWYDFREEFEIDSMVEFLEEWMDLVISSDESFYDLYPTVAEFVDLYAPRLIKALEAHTNKEPSEIIKRLASVI
jgi:hypothetical protein